MRLRSICMEKGRTYFKQDVEFMHEMEFDTVKIDQCGSAMNMSLWAALINATGKLKTTFDNCAYIAQNLRIFFSNVHLKERSSFQSRLRHRSKNDVGKLPQFSILVESRTGRCYGV